MFDPGLDGASNEQGFLKRPLDPAGRHTFIVRIWWEAGLTRPDGVPLWRGQVQYAISGRQRAFQSLDELLGFIQELTGNLEGGEMVQSKNDQITEKGGVS